MATDTIKIVANKQFVEDAKDFFQSKGINIQDMILSYISFRMNTEEEELVELIQLGEEEVTNDILEARIEAKNTPKEDRVSFNDNKHAFS